MCTTGVIFMPSSDSLRCCIRSCVGVDATKGVLADPCITPPGLLPLALPVGIAVLCPDCSLVPSLPLLFLDLSRLLSLDLLLECLEVLPEVSVDDRLLVLKLLDLLELVGLSLGLAPVCLPTSLFLCSSVEDLLLALSEVSTVALLDVLSLLEPLEGSLCVLVLLPDSLLEFCDSLLEFCP